MALDLSAELSRLSVTEQAAHPRLELEIKLRNHGPGGAIIAHDGHAVPTLSVQDHDGLTLPRFYFHGEQQIRDDRMDHHTGYIDLYPGVVEHIEDMRDEVDIEEDLHLELAFSVLARRGSGNEIENMRNTANITIDHHLWEDILADLGYHDHRLVEVAIPPGAIGDVFENAVGHVENAQQAHDSGRYDDALTNARQALHILQTIQNKGNQYRQEMDEEKRDRFDAFIDNFGSSIGTLRSFADLGGHPEEQVTNFEGVILRRDSDFVITVTKAYLTYLSEVLEEDLQWE